jgi:DNA-binding transcriptional LysR family regulator
MTEARTADPTVTLIGLRIVAGMAAGKTQAEIGAELHLEQPAISKLLRAYEAGTGLSIVEHFGRRLALTALGRELARAAARTLAAFDEVDRLAEDVLAARRGTVRILASSTPGNYVLPAIVAAFLREVPQASIQLYIQPIPNLWSSFELEQCDFAVVPALDIPAQLLSEPLYHDAVVFFASPANPLTRRTKMRLDELGAHTVVGKFFENHWLVRDLEQRGFRAGRKVTIMPPEGVKRMVDAGMSVGMLFESSLRNELERAKVIRLPIADPSPGQLFSLVRNPQDPLSPLALRFADFLRSAVQPSRTRKPARAQRSAEPSVVVPPMPRAPMIAPSTTIGMPPSTGKVRGKAK